jgi:hypothetical protein
MLPGMDGVHVAGPVEEDEGGRVQRCLRCDAVLLRPGRRALQLGERVVAGEPCPGAIDDLEVALHATARTAG